MADKIKVMIIDNSALARRIIAQGLASDAQIEVIATAANPLFALRKMRSRWPDVLIIDTEMPRVDGVAFLRKITAEHPTPVVVCSSLAEPGAQAAGAVATITKPRIGLKSFLENASGDLVRAVRSAAKVRPLRRTIVRPKLSADVMLDAEPNPAPTRSTDRIIAIGTSTGGTQALEAVLTSLSASSAGIVIVQHMPAVFTAMFAERLQTLSQIDVREARSGDRVVAGRALLAPGGKHMMLKRSGAHYVVDVVDGPPVNRHTPSVDVLFRSVAKLAGANALGIIMTGMGDDGARGLKEMHDAGAKTIAQDEASCVVFGMPKEAIKLGAVDVTLPLDKIAAAIAKHGANHDHGGH